MKETLEALISRLEFWALVFGIIVVVGVAGESFFGIRIWWNSRKLSRLQGEENQRLEATISELNKSTAEAHRESAEALAKAEAFRLDIAKANERAAEANRVAEEEKLARLKIEERMAGRRVTKELHDRFVPILKPFGGSVAGVTKLGDMEAGVFADDIIKLLQDSNWTVVVNSVGTASPPRYGLAGVIDERTEAGKALASAIKMLPTASVESRSLTRGVASIFVGLKPPP
jgi:hypothetical protein